MTRLNENHLPLISIIVPIYNIEKYVRKCVDSILNQTYKSIEIILVDDGSSDGCPQICDEYAKKDNRIHVIHKDNQGVGFARNTGIDFSTGEYLMFVDSDDYLPSNAVEILLTRIEKDDSDMVIGQFLKMEFQKRVLIIGCAIQSLELSKHLNYWGPEIPRYLVLYGENYTRKTVFWICVFRH